MTKIYKYIRIILLIAMIVHPIIAYIQLKADPLSSVDRKVVLIYPLIYGVLLIGTFILQKITSRNSMTK